MPTGDWSWLSHRALAILSYMARASFADVLVAWALSRAIMQRSLQGEEVAWLLRVNPGDASKTTDAIRGAITRLKAQQNSTCEQAAAYLEAAISDVKRADAPLVVDEGLEEAVAAPLAVADMDAHALYEAMQQDLAPFAWQNHDPENSAALINALIERGLDTHGAALSLLLANLTDLLIVLAPDSRARLRKAITAAHDAIKDESEEDKWTAARLESARLTLQLYDAEPADQSALVLSSGLDAERGEWLLLCQPIALGDLAQVDLKSVAGQSSCRLA